MCSWGRIYPAAVTVTEAVAGVMLAENEAKVGERLAEGLKFHTEVASDNEAIHIAMMALASLLSESLLTSPGA